MTGFWTRLTAVAAVALAMTLCAASPVAAAPAISLSDGAERASLEGHMEVLRDPSGALGIQDMGEIRVAGAFKPLERNLNAGYDRAAYWLKSEIRRAADMPADWRLVVEVAYLDYVDLYLGDGHGGWREVHTGDRTPFATRPVPYRTFVFKLDLDDDGPRPVYLRVKSSGALSVSGQVMSPEAFSRFAIEQSLAYGLANGGLIIIVLFAISQFVASRDRLYLTFLAYAVPLEVMYLALAGYASQFLFPATPQVADAMVGSGACLAIGGGIVFAAKALDFQNHYPRLDWAYHIVGRLIQICAVSPLIGRYGLVAPAIQIAVLISFAVTTLAAIQRTRSGDRVALWFLLAFLAQIAVNSVIVLRLLGLLNTSTSADLLAQFTTVAHLLLLSYGMVQRTSEIEAGHRRTRQKQLESAYQIERALEERVAQRTMELAAANTTLATEIAERRAAEERVVQREHQVRAILDAAPFPMVVAGFPDGTLLFLNQPACELLNVPADMAIGMLTTSFYVEARDRNPLMDALRDKGAVLGTELRIRRMPREQRWVLLSAVRFSYHNQDAVLICLNDISTRKQLEEMLRQANRRSEAALDAERQAMREQRNFLAMVSHEFRVPLAIIEAASQLLGIYIDSDAEADDEVAKIRRAVRRMSDLIDICLADDRLDSSMMSLRPEEVDLRRMLAELCDDKRPFAGNRELVLTSNGPAILDADATLLRIGLSNLIDNALKFSPAIAPVFINVATEDDAVVIRVTDQGPGIAIDEQPRIFEKFYRSTKSDRVRGAGLGLYIVKRIMELHEGAISVDSDGQNGSTFAIWLPRQMLMHN